MATKSIAQTVNTSNFAGKQKSVLRDLFEANASLNSITPTGGTLAVNGAVSASGNLTLSGGTANGVAYLNGSKVVTTGAGLAYDGTTLTATVANGAFAEKLIGATGRINFTPYVNGSVGALIASSNTAESLGLPLTLSGSTVIINTANGPTLEVNASGAAVTGSISATANVTFSGLPTSASGLPSGGLWNDGGTIKIA